MGRGRSLARGTVVVLLVSAFEVGAETTALKVGGWIDMPAAVQRPAATVLVEDGRIREVGEVEIPAAARVVDLRSAVLLPGLYDVHTHLCISADARGPTVEASFERFFAHILTRPTAYRALVGAANARSMLEAGFTTLRDLGNAGDFADVAVQRALREGLFPGPTLDVAGKALATFGGQFLHSPEHPDLARQDYAFADTRDEIRRAIRRNLHFGANWIKVIVDEMSYAYSEEDLKFIVEEAHSAGAKVAAHCGTDRGTRTAIVAGVDSLEHATRATEETLQEAAARGIVLVGTEHPAAVLKAAGLPEEFAEWRAGLLERRLQSALEAGVEMAFGSDLFMRVAGHDRGSAALAMLDSWIGVGMTAPEILRAMITTPARLLDDEEKRGRIAPGFEADLIATASSPLDGIAALRHVVFVMKRGEIIRAPQP